MSVSAVNNSVTLNETQRTIKKTLGKDDFLKLLVTQLRYQDPLNPMEDKEFVAQTAQFTSLEQMQNMAQTVQMQQNMGLLGKEIKAEVTKDNGSQELVYGRVTAVRQSGSEFYLTLNDGNTVKSTEIQSVLGEDGLYQEALGMIGHRVNVREYNAAQLPTGATHQALIINVRLEEGQIKLETSTGESLQLRDILSIVPEEMGV